MAVACDVRKNRGAGGGLRSDDLGPVQVSVLNVTQDTESTLRATLTTFSALEPLVVHFSWHNLRSRDKASKSRHFEDRRSLNSKPQLHSSYEPAHLVAPLELRQLL